MIKCLAGMEHWHVAAPDAHFAYLAITGNEPVQWLEPVTDEEYDNIAVTDQFGPARAGGT